MRRLRPHSHHHQHSSDDDSGGGGGGGGGGGVLQDSDSDSSPAVPVEMETNNTEKGGAKSKIAGSTDQNGELSAATRKMVAIDTTQNKHFTHRLLPVQSPEFDNVIDQVTYGSGHMTFCP